MPRCPNGTRRNKNTGKCEPKNKSKSKNNKTLKSPTDKCVKGVKMPNHRIDNIIKFEKKVNESIGLSREDGYYNKMEMYLNKLCFPKNTKWTNIGSFSTAIGAANKP